MIYTSEKKSIKKNRLYIKTSKKVYWNRVYCFMKCYCHVALNNDRTIHIIDKHKRRLKRRNKPYEFFVSNNFFFLLLSFFLKKKPPLSLCYNYQFRQQNLLLHFGNPRICKLIEMKCPASNSEPKYHMAYTL